MPPSVSCCSAHCTIFSQTLLAPACPIAPWPALHYLRPLPLVASDGCDPPQRCSRHPPRLPPDLSPAIAHTFPPAVSARARSEPITLINARSARSLSFLPSALQAPLR